MERFYPNLDIKSFTSCPLCNNQYGSREIKILSREDESVTLYLNCPNCKNAIISVISAGVLGITVASMVTDLSTSEVERIKNEKAVSTDDVLTIYEFLSRKSKPVRKKTKAHISIKS